MITYTLHGHVPVLVRAPDAPPVECCAACSDSDDDRWVAVTACPQAAANQLPDGSPCEHVIELAPRCSACGRRDQMERWEDTEGSGWQCHATDCFQMTVDGEDE